MASPCSKKPPQSSRSSQKFLSACVALSAVFVLGAVEARAQQTDRARTEALARRAADRLQSLQREADRLATQERTLIGDLRKLELERELKTEELKQVDRDVARIKDELAEITGRMDALQQSEREARPELSGRLVEMYKLGQARYLRLLLSAPDLRRMGQASRTVAALAKLDRDRVAARQRTLDELKSTRATVELRARQLAAARAAASTAEAAAARAVQARNDLIRDIDRRRDLNAQLAGELQAAQQKLQMTLRDLASGTPATEAAALPLRPFRGELDWPVAGTVLRKFGRPAGRAATSSNGIEIGAQEDASALAIHEGTVAFAGAFSGFGNLVILDHGSQTFSLYGDLLDIAVKKGARVERGGPVGLVGVTASGATGVYFELRVDGQPVDPLQWLKRR
jgi:septal ring factor EnvC (AmiA/AmiB activator)